MGRVDTNSIREKIKKVSKVQKEINSKVFAQFEDVKNSTIQDFENHPVSQEIKQGPNGTNNSNTLGGVGNLYSYIGFSEGDNPLEKAKSAINENLKITPVRTNIAGNRYKASYKVSYPSESDIASQTPLPWEPGRSWITGIERGISGFGFYMSKVFLKGRSKTGLQSKNQVRAGSFRTMLYWSEIMSNFFKKLNNIKI